MSPDGTAVTVAILAEPSALTIRSRPLPVVGSQGMRPAALLERTGSDGEVAAARTTAATQALGDHHQKSDVEDVLAWWPWAAAAAGAALAAAPMPTTMATRAIARRQFNQRITCLSSNVRTRWFESTGGAARPHPRRNRSSSHRIDRHRRL